MDERLIGKGRKWMMMRLRKRKRREMCASERKRVNIV